ncbi:hypothetical protein E8E12_007274 [Didymella heteroderae]|uniref:Bud22 domain-containing protein n=1 Tax=Didymella heteroderae TaxID=1769908 RepID=A0A9P5C2C0_9PLEO|nr:hypothetical protein E8E12_007274 [Didymella heteroderae]
MAKRKRSETSPALSDAVPAADKLLKHQKKQVLARLTAAQKPLIAALRLGAGFERQKHSRRKKTAVQKKDTNALTRLDDEYRALKALDLEKVAEQHVRRTIAKVKSLKDHEALPESVREIEKADNEQAKLNVLARLYKVAAVKKEVDALIDDLKEIVGGAEGAGRAEKAGKTRGAEKKEKKKRKVEESEEGEEEEEDVDMLDLSDSDSVAARLFNARIAAPSSGEESDGSLSDNERPPSIGDSDSADPDADLEPASDSEASSFGGFSTSNSSDNAVSRLAPPSEESDSGSASSISLTTTKPSKPTAAPTSSTFLPGLSHATYFSGDESASDLDEKPRKNRRGQRARQKIAEAKYGAKAKHIEKNERKKGWDAKRGAVDTDSGGTMNRKARRELEKGMKAKGGRGPVISGENAAPLGKNRLGGGDAKSTGEKQSVAQGAAGAGGVKKGPKKDDSGPLHPSWEAAKKAKESKKLKIDLGGAKTAKKITFD